MSLLRIANGTVYDSANGVDGVVQDVWIQDGKTVAPPTVPVPGIRKWFEAYYTIQFANYPVDPEYIAHGGVTVECQP